ncbi:MAG TPA: hypothetical protein PLL42_04315 [Bacilli bacterium]|nr:hypothetical protein [Bacilli bacterium]
MARLKSDVLGFVPPLAFIPVLERTKLIIPFGRMIVRKSLTFLKKIHERRLYNRLFLLLISLSCPEVFGII